jgi:hypothetical protein
MQSQCPPELGTLLGVVPVVRSLSRGPRTLTLPSLERWDTCLVASFDIVHAGPVERADRSRAWLEVEAADDRGTRYDAWFGGGLRDGGEHTRLIRKFTPPPDPSAGELLLTARLQLRRQADGFPPRHVDAWEDPEPWVFPVALGGTPPATGEDRQHGMDAPTLSTPASDGGLPELRRLRRVVPVVRSREDAGWAVTFIAAENYDDGFRLVFRLYGAGKAPTNPELALRLFDDRGNAYRSWGGGGNGEPTMGACDWRLAYLCAPALDPDSRELRVEIDEIRSTAVEPVDGEPQRGRLVVGEAAAGTWSFAVDLR